MPKKLWNFSQTIKNMNLTYLRKDDLKVMRIVQVLNSVSLCELILNGITLRNQTGLYIPVGMSRLFRR